MRRFIPLVAGLLLPFAAYAIDSVPLGPGTVTVGDRIGKVYELGGDPDRIVALPSQPGEALKQRFDYVRDGKLISLTLSGGIVVHID